MENFLLGQQNLLIQHLSLNLFLLKIFENLYYIRMSFNNCIKNLVYSNRLFFIYFDFISKD